jgi:hypothetical protein
MSKENFRNCSKTYRNFYLMTLVSGQRELSDIQKQKTEREFETYWKPSSDDIRSVLGVNSKKLKKIAQSLWENAGFPVPLVHGNVGKKSFSSILPDNNWKQKICFCT